MCVLIGCGATDVCVCVRFLFQYNVCNQTGSPHLDLFPLNNETLQVDIYKGVRLKRENVRQGTFN